AEAIQLKATSMLHLIPYDTNFDFMAQRKKAFTFSILLSLASLVLIGVKGFDLGIDFRGGSSAIVAFDRATAPDQSKVEASVKALLTAELNKPDSQVSVQDFGAGAGDNIDGKPVARRLIYTEVTSLVDTAKRKSIEDAIKAKFGADTRVSSSEDAGDTLYLTFGAEADINGRRAELQALFKTLGFESITVVADFERQLEVEFLREIDLRRQDAEQDKSAKEAETAGATSPSAAELDKRKADAIVGKADKRFTVDIEAFQASLANHLAKDFQGAFITVESAAMVSPSVGSDLFNDGMLAILYALIGILIYVTLRFDFRYAPGGVIALAHDAIIAMGFVSLFGIKFALPIVAAILTIIGYSINDTVIVYDRVRETSSGHKGKDLLALLNKAINNTLSRTIFTSGATLVSCIAIMAFGGGSVRDFGLVLFVGVAFGTYSSIFVAVPLIYYLDNIQRKREGDKEGEGPRRNRITRDDSTDEGKKGKKKAAEAAI
ncbi:MAG: protein translocase subunit SecF, partial [Myxococcota bacterium]